jgi:quinolinate synthase
VTSTAPTCAIPAPEETVPEAELIARATAAREALGERLVILGHHYQKHEVIRFADITGDSFLLARRGAEATRADLVVFLGVYFMAEAADILSQPHQRVILPDLGAGCHLAECADIFTVNDAWEQITGAFPDRTIVPLTYMNSGADLKAFVGRNGGAVCTSGNAERAFRWAREQGDMVFFFPDEHLGRNTACLLGMDPSDPVVWDPRQAELGGIAPDALG